VGLDPKVIESIDEFKAKKARDKFVLFLPLVLAVMFVLAIIVLNVFARGYFNRTYTTLHNINNAWVIIIRMLAGAALIALIAWWGFNLYAAVRYAQGRIETFLTLQTNDYDKAGYMVYEDAAGSASIAAGVQQPGIAIFDDTAANAAAFVDRLGNRMIGVTKGLLVAGLSVGEATGVMAHEVAHLIIGDNVKPPEMFDAEFLPSLLIILYGVLAALAVLTAPRNDGYLVLVTIVVAVIFLVLVLIQRSKRFLVKLLDLAFAHDDILADSVAADLTRDPDALVSAIKKVSALATKSDRTPGGTILARYMFVTYPTASGDYVRYATQIGSQLLTGGKQARTWFSFSGMMDEATREIYEQEKGVTRDRLVNLDLIKQGKWQAINSWNVD